jgi:hypothetical protein
VAEPLPRRLKPHRSFRTQAVATVTATLASSIESNIESLVSRILDDYLQRSSEGEPRLRQVK